MKFLLVAALCGLAVVASSEHDSLHYVDDILDNSNYELGILRAVRGALNRFLDQAENLVSRRDDLRDTIGAKIEELRQKIESTIDLSVDKAGDILAEVRREINDLSAEITRRLKQRPSKSVNYDADFELGVIFTELRNMLRAPKVIAEVREYLRSLATEHPIVFLIKAYAGSATDEDVSEVLTELLSGLEDSLAYYRGDYSALGELFVRAHQVLRTDEGLAVLKQYFRDLQAVHPVVVRVRNYVINAQDDDLRVVVDELLSGIQNSNGNYDSTTQIRDLFVRIKQVILSSNKGIAVLREYAHQKLVSTHPVVVLIKRYLQYSSDDDLKELFTELFQNVGYFYGYYDERSDLRELFLQVKDIVLGSQDGLNVIRNYASNLETSNPIALRIKNYFVNAVEDDLKEALVALFGGLE